jgi:hypothetical protein
LQAQDSIIPSVPAKQLTLMIAAALAAGVSCSRSPEETTPVATPSVTLNRSEVAVGTPVDVTYRFEVAADAAPFSEDYLVFAHFVDADGEQMWTDDHEPPKPTRQWKPGEHIEYTRTIFIPKFPYVGKAAVDVGLYSRQSGQRLPLAGTDIGLRAYRTASFDMSRRSDNQFVIFKDGWHETEVAEDGGVEWQWSRKEGTIAFRNPMRDAVLFLQADQAVQAFSEPQRVSVRLAGTVLDSFALPPGMRELRRIQLPAALLGTADTVEIQISVDKTFVPAEVPGLRSTDSRELGIRVFRAYVEPK